MISGEKNAINIKCSFCQIKSRFDIRNERLPHLFCVTTSYFINGAVSTIISIAIYSAFAGLYPCFYYLSCPRAIAKRKIKRRRRGGGGLRVTLNKEAEIRKPVPPVLYACIDDGKCARVSKLDARFLLAMEHVLRLNKTVSRISRTLRLFNILHIRYHTKILKSRFLFYIKIF